MFTNNWSFLCLSFWKQPLKKHTRNHLCFSPFHNWLRSLSLTEPRDQSSPIWPYLPLCTLLQEFWYVCPPLSRELIVIWVQYLTPYSTFSQALLHVGQMYFFVHYTSFTPFLREFLPFEFLSWDHFAIM